MKFCGAASTWAKLALVLSIVALGLHAAGYATNYWMAKYSVRDIDNIGVGLWKSTDCSGYYEAPCYVGDVPSTYTGVTHTVVRALESCALVLLFVVTVMLLCYVGAERARSRGMAIAIISVAFFAICCSVAGMGTWMANLPETFTVNWSFGLTIIALLLAIILLILMIPEVNKYDYKARRKNKEFHNQQQQGQQGPPAQDPGPPQPPRPALPKKPIIPSNPSTAPRYDYAIFKNNAPRY